MRTVSVDDFMRVQFPNPITPKLLVNIRGCNGAGKSTVPMRMKETDPYVFEVSWLVNGKPKTLCTVFPSYGFLALGHYRAKTGGMDTINSTQTIKDAVTLLYTHSLNIIMEGIMASTVFQTYADLFHELDECIGGRRIVVYNILPPLGICLERIQQRNGGKPIKEDLVKGKWLTVDRNAAKFEVAGFESLKFSNEDITRDETLNWFFGNLGENCPFDFSPSKLSHNPKKTHLQATNAKSEQNKSGSDGEKMTKAKRMKALPKYSGKPEPLYLPTVRDLDGYAWAEYYKAPDPDKVRVNWDNMRLYWYWIAERMSIWYKRTIQRQPFPWTDDHILQENKFTNCFRDLDRGTIVYIKEILRKMDEPTDNLEQRTKEVILNTQIYRLFLKYDTWKQIGFLYLPTLEEQWEQAKANLRDMKARGETIWHSAYFVNDLKSANPDPESSHDKVENAICLCDSFIRYLDDTYTFITEHGISMRECLKYLTHFPAIGAFTVYEWLCDWGMSYKYVEHPVVDWTDDDYVNIGPGNKMGLDFIFEDHGNLDYFQLNFYLRASWRHYMQRYGYYDQFISQLPDWANNDINMRLIEHDLCELQKYLNVYYGTGKCKNKFNGKRHSDLDALIV